MKNVNDMSFLIYDSRYMKEIGSYRIPSYRSELSNIIMYDDNNNFWKICSSKFPNNAKVLGLIDKNFFTDSDKIF
jgi:hypothetical protein